MEIEIGGKLERHRERLGRVTQEEKSGERRKRKTEAGGCAGQKTERDSRTTWIKQFRPPTRLDF